MLRGGNNCNVACTTTTTTTPGDDDDSNDDNVSLECADSGLGLPSDQDADQRDRGVARLTPSSTVYQPTTTSCLTTTRQHGDSQPVD